MADRHPGVGNDRKLREYWTRGKGAAKIRWGTPHDLTRCHHYLSKYVGPEDAWGLCQTYHRDATGAWNDQAPGER